MAKTLKERLVTPKRPPYELAKEYLVSKSVTRDLFKLYTSGDNISENSVSNSNFMARYELRRIEKLLKCGRVSAAEKEDLLDQQWADLQKREDALRDMFVQFNGFIMDNRDKRARASERILEMASVHRKRNEHIVDLNEKCRDLEEAKKQINKKLVDYKMFEEFLTGTVQAYPEDFDNVLDVINRYEVIRHTSEELIRQNELEVDCLNRATKEFERTVDRCVVTLSGLNTRVALLRERRDAVQRECRRWEELLGRVGAETSRRLLEFVAVRDSCRRIHVEACRRRGVRPAPEGDLAAQLEGIKKALLDYRNVNERARRAREEELAASERARPSNESV